MKAISILFALTLPLYVHADTLDGAYGLVEQGSFGAGGACFPDDAPAEFGNTCAAPDCWFEWDTAGTDSFSLICTDVDGGGTDGKVWRVDTGTDDVVFTGNLTAVNGTFSSATFPPLLGTRTGTGTNAIVGAIAAQATTTNDMADGFGPALYYRLTDSGASDQIIAFIGAVRDGADNSGKLMFQTYSSGTGDNVMSIDKSGYVYIGDYDGAGNQAIRLDPLTDNTLIIANEAGAAARVHFTGQTTHAVNTVTCATATDDFDINWNNGNIAFLDMEDCDQDANDINAPTNPVAASQYTIVVKNSDAGTEDLTWNAVFLFPGGTDPVLSQEANEYDVISCAYVDSVYLCSFAQNYD